MSDVIQLVSLPTLRTGAVDEAEKSVFANVRSVGQRETYAAAAVGVKPEYTVQLADYLDYNYQPFARVDGRLFKIYRTFRSNKKLELTLTAPVGMRDKLETCRLGVSGRSVYCVVAYLQMSEIDEAGLAGLTHELHLIVAASEYNGEEIVEYSGRTYAIRRVFQEDNQILDLYVEERAGL